MTPIRHNASKNDPNIQEEARAICIMLPNITIKHVQHILRKNFDDPRRRSKALQECIDYLTEAGNVVRPQVFKILDSWKATPVKRPADLELTGPFNKILKVNVTMDTTSQLATPTTSINSTPEILELPSCSRNGDLPIKNRVKKSNGVAKNTGNSDNPVVFVQIYLQQLREMFPDADPDFLAEKARATEGDETKLVDTIMDLSCNKEYPRMDDYMKRQKQISLKQKFIEEMNVEEFLKYFEDPEKVFRDSTSTMSDLYKSNSRQQLLDDFPYNSSEEIECVLQKYNYHYFPALQDMKARKRAVKGIDLGDMDDIFLKELTFTKMEKEIQRYCVEKRLLKELTFDLAKEIGQLQECRCCFDNEIVKSDMSPCANLETPHHFCNECIRRYSVEQIGQGQRTFSCINEDCKSEFSLNVLQTILKPSIFSNILKRKQEEEIAAAGLEDLESCPFCSFATIMPNKNDKVFKCLNPECLKDSCRLCKESNHIPLRCNEIENKKQTNARTYLENEMSEAIVRECYKCKKRFIKEEGCNRMTCSCGAMMCYICKQPIIQYDHFYDNNDPTIDVRGGMCPLWSNSLQLHTEEVRKRAEEAKKNLDPEIELLHDPTNDLPVLPQENDHLWNDQYYDDTTDSEEHYDDDSDSDLDVVIQETVVRHHPPHNDNQPQNINPVLHGVLPVFNGDEDADYEAGEEDSETEDESDESDEEDDDD